MDELLKKHHLKVTDCRFAMLTLLAKHSKPMTVETMHKKLKQRFDLVTMYRNVEAFSAAGILFTEIIGRAEYYYLAQRQHHHIVCRDCKKMECIPCDHKPIRVPRFSHITHQLVLSGVCEACNSSD